MKKTLLSAIAFTLVLTTLLFSSQVLAFAELVEDKVLLEWARSIETSEDAFIVEVDDGSWDYSEAIEKTPLKYFQTPGVEAAAAEKSDKGLEKVVDENQDKVVDSGIIWDGGQFFDKYKNENGNVLYDWASWEHFGTDGNPDENKGDYSLRRFTSYLTLTEDEYNALERAIIAPEDELGNMSYLFPINDTVFVFVNGTLAFWGGTDLVEGDNQYGALNRTSFMNKGGIKVRNGVNGVFKSIYPHTDGWCIDLEQNADDVDVKYLLSEGDNRIDIFVDDYWEGGGMNKLSLFLTTADMPTPVPSASYISHKEVFLEDGITPVNEAVNPGTILTYKITVSSTGDLATDYITISDEIPANTSYVEGEGGTLSGNTVVWDAFRLSARGEGTEALPESYTVEFKVAVNDDAFNTVIDNFALVDGKETNTVTVNTKEKTIDVEALTKGDVKKNIVIAFDMSMTMKDSSSINPAINALKTMVNSIFANGKKATVNFITFNYKAHDHITVDETNYQELIAVISGLKPAMALNGTNMANALDVAYENLNAMKQETPDAENFLVFIGDGQPHNSQQPAPVEADGKKPTDYADERNNYANPVGLYAVTDAMKNDGIKIFSIYYGLKLSDVPKGTERNKQQAGMTILTTMSSNTANDNGYYYNTNTGNQLQTAIAKISADLEGWEAGRDVVVSVNNNVAEIDISAGLIVSKDYPVIVSVNDIETSYESIESLPDFINIDNGIMLVNIAGIDISAKIKISYYEKIQ